MLATQILSCRAIICAAHPDLVFIYCRSSFSEPHLGSLTVRLLAGGCRKQPAEKSQLYGAAPFGGRGVLKPQIFSRHRSFLRVI